MSLKLLRRVAAFFDGITSSLAIVGAVLIIAAMLMVSLDVIVRYFLHRPQAWVAEFAPYMVAWVPFLSAAWILKEERHVKVEIVEARLSPRARVLLGISTSIVGAILCSLVVVYGTQLVWDQFQTDARFPTVMRPLKAPLFAVIPTGSALLSIQFLRRSYGYLDRWLVKRNGQKRQPS